MLNILKSIPAADEKLVKELAQCSVATVHEALGQIGALDGAIKPLDRNMRIFGLEFKNAMLISP